ncbi:hypothetical protein [Paenibacillus sp. URB8-2]|uniref:hypothetical protein n=1 Tax=Paenibacillus sp. URB8-2 TaxID=2741301 RepID=UPI0015BD1806|nr:hypothetical protein [Paenibacillus sp. URB8-2]BCG59792.1 hypothetical protein PUR_32170 [Paenibacillus sp. URB8-2]
MKLYRMSSRPHGTERLASFLEDCFVSIGWPGIGNLEHTDREELRERFAAVYGSKLLDPDEAAAGIELFVHNMRDGDYMLLTAPGDEYVYLGDLGDYFYDEQFDNEIEGLCHRRGVTWLSRIPQADLDTPLKSWLGGGAGVSVYHLPAVQAGLDRWLNPQPEPQISPAERVKVDTKTIEEALEILKSALRSEDPERRERAAAAILGYAGGQPLS